MMILEQNIFHILLKFYNKIQSIINILNKFSKIKIDLFFLLNMKKKPKVFARIYHSNKNIINYNYEFLKI